MDNYQSYNDYNVEEFRELYPVVDLFLNEFELKLRDIFKEELTVTKEVFNDHIMFTSELCVHIDFENKTYTIDEKLSMEEEIFDKLCRYDWFNNALPLVIIDIL